MFLGEEIQWEIRQTRSYYIPDGGWRNFDNEESEIQKYNFKDCYVL